MAREEKNVGAGREMRKKPALLDDVADPPAYFLRARFGDLCTVKDHAAAIGFEKTDDQTQESRLAAAARADQRSR